MPAKIPGNLTDGKCVICGQPYSIANTKGPNAPIPYTKNNKTGYAHTKCVKGDKANDPAHNDPGSK